MLAGDPEVELVGEAASGSEAVARIVTCRPDVVLLDVQIPDLDGFGVLRERRDPAQPAVIFVTCRTTRAHSAPSRSGRWTTC
jgi:two-component system, LytTR family, response regulator